ncbi:MAG: hypothetical protein DME04_21560 [Candidatus Rokuibacteriota bacterium]|nr:MAG: hypothetical protein DME04_21560 [Candidatus Rokubacteria bacterium]
MVQELGEMAWTLKADPMNSYLESLERGLRAGRFRGIGELFVNNTSSHPRGFPPTKYPADSPLVRRLLALSAKYAVPLSIHMDAEADSVAGLEALVATERSGVVIWAHCGTWAHAALIRRLLQQQPNLLCELSWRDAVHLAKVQRGRGAEITGFRTKLAEDWRELLEAFSDRFLVGTDADDLGQYKDIIDFYRKVLGQLSPEAAQRIGSGNAKRIFRLD